MAKRKLLKQDLIYTNVRKIISDQQAKSRAKFGITMAARKKPLKIWIRDVQEELVDTLLYLEKIKHELPQPNLAHKSNKGKH
jgi:hypothetical protein